MQCVGVRFYLIPSTSDGWMLQLVSYTRQREAVLARPSKAPLGRPGEQTMKLRSCPAVFAGGVSVISWLALIYNRNLVEDSLSESI